MFETLEIERDASGIATLWLSRAEKHNALSARMIAELTEAAQVLGQDGDLRAVILAARGKSFCAGADLGWMREQFEATPDVRAKEATKLAMMLHALNTLPKPLIGRVHGNAFGGGVGMVSVCDAVIAAEPIKMALTETKLGLIPATIGPYVAARMGEAKARRVFMSGRVFQAAEAVGLDLVSRAVPLGDLHTAVEEEVTPYLACAPGAVGQAKAMLRGYGSTIDDDTIARSISALTACWAGAEAREGIGAFFDKRKPAWTQT